MLLDILLPSELSIDSFEVENTTLVLAVSSTNQNGICPNCQGTSERVHSRYQRQPVDLPVAGYTVRLDITARRFFCLDDQCQCLTFSERMPAILEPYARRTNRLTAYLRQVAFVVGGEAGARLLHAVGISVSPDTLLRLIRSTPEPEVKTPRVLGVDDWALRKGHSYGTILVDLETHQPVDLLPDRTAASLQAWLKKHPGVEIISRDRSKEYIKGATSGAPSAIQVADRWHLLKNLRENLESWLETNRACLKAAADKSKQSNPEREKLSSTHAEQLEENTASTTTEEPPQASVKLTKAEKQKLARRAKRQERYESVIQVHEQGVSKSEIARQLNMDRKTVCKYIKAETCPVYPEGRTRTSKLAPYHEYITKRFEEGCTNATQILAEIRQLGYSGSRSVMMDWVKKELRSSYPSRNEPSPPGDCQLNLQPKKVVPWTARRTSWLFVKEELSCDDRQALEQMKQANEEVTEVYSLGQRFVNMIKERQPSALIPWLEDAAKSGIDALKGFAKGIKQDYDAVNNALRLPWSQGQVEGQVNRLKLIKRQMYGRANFDLLRKKVLSDVLIEVPP